ncbi:transposase family protein [Longispora sp. K20-0274]|uniref:transposase family protein n=1 Tax=Longispora sp. K20-0274 TaxID=3088255 RepID=UPI00399AEBFC
MGLLRGLGAEWIEVFTGLPAGRFARLVALVRRRGGDGPGGGRPWCLPLSDRVLVVAVYYRTNLTMRQLGPMFGISAATVHRIVAKLGPLLAIAPVRRSPDAFDRVWIVDGTLVPVRDRELAASSKNYRFSANVQIIIDADSRLVVATGKPVRGNVNDAQAYRDSGAATQVERSGVVVLADGAYHGTGAIIPHRKRAGRPLLPTQEADNTAHRKVRARIEHVIGRLKDWKILRDCRLKRDGLIHAIRAIAHMHNLAMTT